MKRIISILTLSLLFVATINAQASFTETSSGGFNVNSGSDIGEQIEILGVDYDIYETASGSQYVILNSNRTRNDYPLWIHQETEHTFEGKTVYRTRKGSYCVFAKGKSGQPYYKYLTMTE